MAADKTQTLNTDMMKLVSIRAHFKLHATQLKQLTQTQRHPFHDLNAHLNSPKKIKPLL